MPAVEQRRQAGSHSERIDQSGSRKFGAETLGIVSVCWARMSWTDKKIGLGTLHTSLTHPTLLTCFFIDAQAEERISKDNTCTKVVNRNVEGGRDCAQMDLTF